MGRFLESVLRLAAFAACLGVSVAGVGCGGESASERSGLRIEGTEPGDCSDDADNDADGLFDCDDPGCAGASSCSDGGAGGSDGTGGTGGSMLCADVDCDDQNECTADVCNPADGECDYTLIADGLRCDFGSLPGICTAGVCEDAMLCAGIDCNDLNECTEDTCDPMDGMCGHTNVTDGTSCDFGGLPGLCAAGTCTEICLSIQVTPTRSIPNVMFLLDQSGSMDANFGGGENRWEAANTVINGIVGTTDSIVRYGLTTYTSDNGTANPPCPKLPTQIDFALDNSSNIGDDGQYPYSYPSSAGADTPTGDSIDALVGNIQASPPPNEGPTIIVLATDGEPDSCEYPNPSNSTQRAQARGEAVSAAGASYDAGIELFVLWVGNLSNDPSDPTRSHMQDVANAGIDGSGTVYVGDDPGTLSDAFLSIISDSISCDVQMDKRFDDEEKACQDGDVQLNGTPLSCPEDWRVKDGTDDVIELVGSACDAFKSGDVTFSATFPCGAIVVE